MRKLPPNVLPDPIPPELWNQPSLAVIPENPNVIPLCRTCAGYGRIAVDIGGKSCRYPGFPEVRPEPCPDCA